MRDIRPEDNIFKFEPPFDANKTDLIYVPYAIDALFYLLAVLLDDLTAALVMTGEHTAHHHKVSARPERLAPGNVFENQPKSVLDE